MKKLITILLLLFNISLSAKEITFNNITIDGHSELFADNIIKEGYIRSGTNIFIGKYLKQESTIIVTENSYKYVSVVRCFLCNYTTFEDARNQFLKVENKLIKEYGKPKESYHRDDCIKEEGYLDKWEYDNIVVYLVLGRLSDKIGPIIIYKNKNNFNKQ